MSRFIVAVTVLLVSGCTTIAPAQRTVDPDTLPNCTRACGQLGMRLAAVVIVDETGGCVCEPASSASGAGAGASGATVRTGTAAIAGGEVIAEQQKRQAAQSQRPGPR